MSSEPPLSRGDRERLIDFSNCWYAGPLVEIRQLIKRCLAALDAAEKRIAELEAEIARRDEVAKERREYGEPYRGCR